MKLNVLAHCSYIGTTGINAQYRNFHRALSDHCNLKVRNYTVGDSWKGRSDTPHNDEPYLTEKDKRLLHIQTLWDNKQRVDYPMYDKHTGSFDVHIVSELVDHYYYYDEYKGYKIGFPIWESTKMPENFFNRLKTFDEVWSPSQWQKDCMVAQGMDEGLIKVVPSGVESDIFFPEEVTYDQYYADGRFKFVMFGRWDYRKSTKEIIETFLNTFHKNERVDLIISVDNGWPADGMKTTEERLKHFNLIDDRIKVVHFAKRADYIKFLKKGHVFLSCSRGEGANLPLMEAMACGTPSIYSECTGQLEFTHNNPLAVSIKGSCPSNTGDGGEYSQPDYDHLSLVMRDVYLNYESYKKSAVEQSVEIREKYDWKMAGKRGAQLLEEFYTRMTVPINADKERIKVLFVAPHLSTGGMPQFFLKRVESVKDECDVYCVEYEQIATEYVVQRNKLIEMLGDRFITLHDQPKEKLLELMDSIKPDVVHFEEFPETFLDKPIAQKIYRKSRNYLIFEGYHGLCYDPKTKMYFPDKFLFVSDHQADIYKGLGVPYEVMPYPIDDNIPNKEAAQKELGLDPSCKHVLNVGLFTRGKNQGELMRYAKSFLGEKVKFHFVGNQAINFEDYWGPLMKDLPNNCIVWGERKDVEKFYQACDLLVFTSVFETSPLVIREAISWKLPVLAHNIPSYKGLYDSYPSVKYLSPNDADANINLIKQQLQ